MTTQRTQPRRQQAAVQELPSDIDKLLERSIKAEAKRKAYNQRPDVKEKRKKYQKKQQDMRKLASAALAGKIDVLVNDFGYTPENAQALVDKAKSVKVTTS